MKVFLGGTCNKSTWRDELIPMLNIEYFNPVVDDWTPNCMAEEIKQRETCDIVLYVITPKMTGMYSIAEVVDDSNKRPEKTILVILREDEEKRFDDGKWRSLDAILQMVGRNGGSVFTDLKSAAININNQAKCQIKCPALSIECIHYKYQLDRNGDLDICFCNHPENTDKHEGNCTKCLCPLWKGDEDDG